MILRVNPEKLHQITVYSPGICFTTLVKPTACGPKKLAPGSNRLCKAVSLKKRDTVFQHRDTEDTEVHRENLKINGHLLLILLCGNFRGSGKTFSPICKNNRPARIHQQAAIFIHSVTGHFFKAPPLRTYAGYQ